MEHTIVSQIAKHLQEHNIPSNSQFGFRSMDSCESQLFVTLHDIIKPVDNKLQVDAAILDFSKVFDKVTHAILLYKLNYNYGIINHNYETIINQINILTIIMVTYLLG